jgi:hypothetical protein
MRRRVIRTAAAGLLAAAALAGLTPAAQAASGRPNAKCDLDRSNWPGAVHINKGGRISSGATVTAKDNESVLTMQPDGNLVLSLVNDAGGPNHPIWSSGTWGHAGAYAVMQWDGNFVIYPEGKDDSTGGALWSTQTSHQALEAVLYPGANFSVVGDGTTPWSTNTWDDSAALCTDPTYDRFVLNGAWSQSASAWLILQADGNLVIYRKRDGAATWSSGTGGHPGAVMQMQRDGNLVIYWGVAPGNKYGPALWSSGTWNNPGAYSLLQDDGNFVVYAADGHALWSTNTRA